MLTIHNILKFTELLNKFQTIKRAIYHKGKETYENDVEHSYQLAMLAFYIIEVNKLELNLTRALKYALVHDLLEVYAGDTFAYDKIGVASKEQREEKARERLQQEFPEFKELHFLIEEYEKKEDKESKFVYALDKILPMMNIYLDEGRCWRKYELTLDKIKELKSPKVRVSPQIEQYFNELMALIEQREKELF